MAPVPDHPPAPPAANWWRRPLRAIHTVLREPDAADYDLEGVLAWLKRWRANVYAVNGGGLCAFYQTEIPLHRKNRFLNGRDLFKEIVDACHAEGIKVIARCDFRGMHPDMFEAHPDWAAYDADGRPKRREVLFGTCPNSPFRNDGFAIPLIDEVLGRCGADGIWENAASFGGRCYCRSCCRTFRAETGVDDIPLEEDWEDPVWRRYVRWRYERVREHTARLRDAVKRHGSDRSYCGEFFSYLEPGARESAEDTDEIRDLWDYQMVCIFPLTRGSYRSPLLPVPVWRAEEQMKYLRATGGGNWSRTTTDGGPTPHDGGAPRPPAAPAGWPAPSSVSYRVPQTPVMLYGHFDNRSRYTTPAREEMALWLAGMAAQGGSPWDCSFVGVPPERWWDRRHQDVQERFYAFMAAHEADFAGLESVAEVALVHSQRTQDRFASGDPAHDGYITHQRGWMLALFAAHRQWDVLPPSSLTAEGLRPYRAVVLPNVACLSDEEAAALRAYVGRGGGLIATYETGCYTADGARRETGALDDLLGVRGLPAPVRGPLPHSYARLRRDDGAAHPLLGGFDGTDVITNEGYVRQVSATDGQVHATLIPEIFPQPPDLSYPALRGDDVPLVVTRLHGRGRVVYLAGQTDRLNVTSGHPDHGRLLANALAWTLEERPSLLETDAPEDVHVTLLRQPASGRLYVHLVNYTGARGRPVAAPHPTGAVRLSIDERLIRGGALRAALLVSQASVPVERGAGRVTATVPRVDRHEIVRIAATGSPEGPTRSPPR
ncbi:MAG TPA: alpha-amylase family protein [Longimicrobium sp.]|nr:alpha-amylase family protein [Longimicrobium sp.]